MIVRHTMRAFAATLGSETNSFSPIPTGWAGFETAMLWRPGEHPDVATEATGPMAALRAKRAEGWEVVEGTCAFAWPGGPVRRDVYEALRDEIVAQIKAAAPLDVIALGVHGAMMAHGYDDCESDFLEHVRAVAGEAVIGAVFDLHAHMSQRMVDAADLLIGFKLYPHTDFMERSIELVDALARIRSGKLRPTPSLYDCHMMIGFRTTTAPWRRIVRNLVLAEKRPGVINATIVHGFGLGDCADMGTKVLVTTDNDQALAARTAAEIGTKLQALRERAKGRHQDLAATLRSAAASRHFPVILADTTDNPGGGNAGDDMTVLRALRDAKMAPACGGPIWDPQATRFCFEAGVGAHISLRVGGKTGPGSGPPLDLEGEVVGLRRGATQRIGGFDAPLGDIAAFKADGLTLVLSTLRDQAYHPSLFEHLGIDLDTQRFVVVKSSQQFRIGFEPRAGRIISVSRPRANLIYRKRPRPMWPFELDGGEDPGRAGLT